MMLLSFSSAAKYVLSMMLAVLGIIPFENIEVPSQRTDAKELTFMSIEQPYKVLDNTVFTDETSFFSKFETETIPFFIPIRNDHPLEYNFARDLEEVEHFHCSVTTETINGHKGCSQIIIYFKDLETEVKNETVFLLNSNI